MSDIDVIATCMEKFCEDDFEIVGDGLAREVADDALSGRRFRFKQSTGGYSFDLAGNLGNLFSFASLVVALLQLYYQIKAERREERIQELQRQAASLEQEGIPVKELAATIVELKEP